MPVSTLFSRLVTRTYPARWSDQPREILNASISSLKPIDIEFMRQLHTKVNLIPIIAKADTLTDEEIAEFKARVSLEF